MKPILVVDDALTVRMYHRQILESAGFRVDEAANGYEGLERALKVVYGLFLIDINMPKMDGYSLVRALRANEETRPTPIVMISTEAEAEDRDLAYVAGANVYLVKPVRPEDLILNVRMLAGRSAS
jgi:two-component system chemotaxis response regulator CheY